MSTAHTDIAPHPSAAGMSLLSNGIPLSLLMDIALGPHSEEVLARELSQVPAQRPPAA